MGVIRDSPKILITGSNGQLGQKLILHCLEHNIDFLATANSYNKFSACPEENYKIMDVTDCSRVKPVISSYKPTHIINAAAMTNVDLCEIETELCYSINTEGVKNLLEAAIPHRVHFIQISTDFIFDGNKKAYNEEDLPNPLGVYGKSKWEGEQILLNSKYPLVSVLRTSILYGKGEALNKSNIFAWAMGELRAGKNINIVNDQFRTPTFVNDLAKACFLTINKKAYGVYNIAGEELDSMYNLILKVADYLDFGHEQVHPISSEKLNQKAPRPLSSGLIIDKAFEKLDYRPTKFVKSLSQIDPLN